MPFTDEEGEPLERIALEQVLGADDPRGAGVFVLTRSFRYRDARTGESILVPASEKRTDLASVPTFLWGLIAPFGKQSAAALLHDHLRSERPVSGVDRAAQARRADRLFRDALLESGVPTARAWLMWAGVSLTRDEDVAPTAARLRVVHAIAIAAVLALTIVRVSRGTARPTDALRAATSIAGAGLHGDRAGAVLLIAVELVALGPFAIAAWLGARVQQVIETTVWLLTGRRGRRPDGRPTLSRR
ncbi:DUF1353 domain-containing protein [Microbacteriaceae bacterium VKM Ac-2855]|nr:DUF1353 domain-containing protein [Microbacteriaceae bacterium VKM Ac-2855]